MLSNQHQQYTTFTGRRIIYFNNATRACAKRIVLVYYTTEYTHKWYYVVVHVHKSMYVIEKLKL